MLRCFGPFTSTPAATVNVAQQHQTENLTMSQTNRPDETDVLSFVANMNHRFVQQRVYVRQGPLHREHWPAARAEVASHTSILYHDMLSNTCSHPRAHARTHMKLSEHTRGDRSFSTRSASGRQQRR